MENLILSYYYMLLSTTEARICRDIRSYTGNDERDYYPYIPSNEGHIIDLWKEVRKIKNKENKKFIDIGCGYPAIPLLMRGLGFNAYGLELSKEIYFISSAYCRKYGNVSMINENILNIKELEHDVIYMYNPIANPLIMIDGIKVVVKAMKPGAILLFACANGTVADYLEADLNAVKVKRGYNLFKYIKK